MHCTSSELKTKVLIRLCRCNKLRFSDNKANIRVNTVSILPVNSLKLNGFNQTGWEPDLYIKSVG